LWSDSWANGEPIPARFAAARPDARPGVAFSDNRNPHLAWSDVPGGTRSFALIGHDFDMPTRHPARLDPAGELAPDVARSDFFLWVLVDLPADLVHIDEGRFSRAFVAGGKPGPQVPGLPGARHGLNDFTGWFASDARLAGRYHGYDGPFPPVNDPLVHHCVFTVYALGVDRAPVDAPFTGTQVRVAIHPHVLAEATLSGTYSLNPRLRR
jgi:phosphatidylethanolamine-binding protein (PEBP) family uncharacterized protein